MFSFKQVNIRKGGAAPVLTAWLVWKAKAFLDGVELPNATLLDTVRFMTWGDGRGAPERGAGGAFSSPPSPLVPIPPALVTPATPPVPRGQRTRDMSSISGPIQSRLPDKGSRQEFREDSVRLALNLRG